MELKRIIECLQELIDTPCNCRIVYYDASRRCGNWSRHSTRGICGRCSALGKLITFLEENTEVKSKKEQERLEKLNVGLYREGDIIEVINNQNKRVKIRRKVDGR